MRRVLLILGNDIRRHLKSPLVIVIFIAIPLFMTGIIGLVFGPRTEDSQLPAIPMLLVDNDKGFLAKLMLGAFDADEMKKNAPGYGDRRGGRTPADGGRPGLGHGRHP